MRVSLVIAGFLLTAVAASAADKPAIKDAALEKAIAGPQRSPNLVTRDSSRHPLEELEFFGIKPTMTVVEIWPAPGYWTEILAPYLHDHGTYYAAGFKIDPLPPVEGKAVASADGAGFEERVNGAFQAKLDADKAVYGNVHVTGFGRGHYDIAPPGSADMVLTFRNLHNWMSSPSTVDAALAGFYKALKPGGILGIEDHRGRNDQPQDPEAKNGYVRQDYAVQLAEKAGFKFIGASEIDANPKDTADWPKGVWTLPPTLAMGAQDRDKYLAIGEADNFVLKFQKPISSH